MKTSEIYSIFSDCFPRLTLSHECFERLLAPEECELVTRAEGGRTVGFAAVKGGNIRLICVRREYQGRGAGKEILSECEEKIKAAGFDRARLGDSSWLFLGAEETSAGFFEKQGYTFEGTVAELSLKRENFDMSLIKEPAVKTEFRFAKPHEHEKIISAVAMVEEDWCRYFTHDTPVFAAFYEGEPCSFCIAEDNCDTLLTGGNMNIGSVGCVGTVPHMREKGIGLAMVGKAAAYLFGTGCHQVYIHYTHLEKWYGKLGFEPFIHFRFGEKSL